MLPRNLHFLQVSVDAEAAGPQPQPLEALAFRCPAAQLSHQGWSPGRLLEMQNLMPQCKPPGSEFESLQDAQEVQVWEAPQ